METLKEKRVCANCGYRFSCGKNVGYDHFVSDRCSMKNGEVCSDIWNTTCDSFTFKVEE